MLSKLEKLPNLLGLTANPFLLTLTIAIYNRHGIIPKRKAELFAQFVAGLISQRGKLAVTRQRPWIDDTLQIRALTALAVYLNMEKHQTFATSDETLQIFRQACPQVQAEHLLVFAISANILQYSQEVLRFGHQLFQEYFAAFRLDEALSQGVSASQFFSNEEWWKPTGWEEAAILLVGMGVGISDPWRVVKWLQAVQPILAWRCIVENNLALTHPIARRLMEPQFSQRTAPLARCRWGIENRENDTRRGIGCRPDGLPDIDWVIIPAGEFIMGSDKTTDPQASWSFEGPQHLENLPAYRIGRYPITYAQYRAFLLAEDGFANDRWWADFVRPSSKDPNESPLNYPVNNVSWYEAIAFCQWLSTCLGYEITLPTEAQWEKAARGTDGRFYPYGNRFDPTKANGQQAGIGQPCAVGLFPNGASPYGVMDMGGNVAEWCLSRIRSSYKKPENTGPTGVKARMVRGSHFRHAPKQMRCAYREYQFPEMPLSQLGFRIVSAG